VPDLTNLEGLIIVLLAIVPGYTAIALYRRTKTYERPDSDLRTFIPAIAVSFVIQVLVFPWTAWQLLPVRNDLAAHPVRLWLWGLAVVLLIPVVGGLLVGRLTDVLLIRGSEPPGRVKKFAARLLPQVPPSPWDTYFLDPPADGDFVILTFDDGSMRAGAFYGPAFAMTSPQQQGIYLAEEWLLDADGNIDSRVLGSKGLLVPLAAKIKYVRILRPGDAAGTQSE
jgi:Family of unknown function (DUF6338)